MRSFYLAFFSKEFAYNLMWPGAAGNVFWSLLFLIVDRETRRDAGGTFLPRMLLLGLVSFYLAVDWHLEMKGYPGRPDISTYSAKPQYWFVEQLHVLCLVVAAIATAANEDITWTVGALSMLFGVTAVGHLSGVWGGIDTVALLKGVVNIVGFVLVFVWSPVEPASFWRPVLAFGVALILWLLLLDVARRKPTLYSKLV